ncbi:MAG TPA: glycerol-3-phosphate 1-O-acyltransferase PlsY [Opitutaceae bacterium]|nr:glycerol-3-phosphate 1-O-acyltransferase PlsY [Opitutaceae bacterium]
MLVPILIAAVVGYLLGSLPFGYLIARAKGVNIFEVGSKSSGATNVKRVLGAGPGNLVFFLDVLKGAVATAWPMFFFFWQAAAAPRDPSMNTVTDQMLEVLGLQMGVVGLVGAISGHSYSCFIKFRGGKGVATAAGGFLVLLPMETLIAGAVWIIAFYASRYVSLASILAAVALPVATFFLVQSPLLLWLAAIIAFFVIIRHRANIVRLLDGTENKFVKKKENSQ